MIGSSKVVQVVNQVAAMGTAYVELSRDAGQHIYLDRGLANKTQDSMTITQRVYYYACRYAQRSQTALLRVKVAG